jgi:hypothetical protein
VAFRPTAAGQALEQHRGARPPARETADPSGLGFGGFWTARRTLVGFEAMAMIRKGQVQNIGDDDIRAQATFIDERFGVAA